MKKNLLSIIILALLIVNLAMTGFMLLSVMTTNSQTAKLISDIAAALELEANGGATGGFTGSAGAIAVTDMATWGFTGDEKLTIALKPGEDGKTHYMVVEVVFSLNKASADYATLGTEENLANVKEVVKSEITNTLSGYTMEELQSGMDQIAKETILENVQSMFNSNFIYDISFSSVLYS